VQAVRRLFAAYSQEERPLAAYALLIGAYNLGLASVLGASQRAGRPLPERVSLADLLLLGVATHRLSRLLAKDSVTSVLRAPFTEFQGMTGASEVNEKPRGTGLQRALGELLTCPFCMGQWVGMGFACGLLLAPRATRFVASAFATVTISDFLQFAYDAIKQEEEQLGRSQQGRHERHEAEQAGG
jgi:hypothetical protein